MQVIRLAEGISLDDLRKPLAQAGFAIVPSQGGLTLCVQHIPAFLRKPAEVVQIAGKAGRRARA